MTTFFPKRIKELIVGNVVVEGAIPKTGHGDHFERERVDDTKESEVDASSRELDRVLIGVESLKSSSAVDDRDLRELVT